MPVLAVILILTSGCTSGPPDLDGDGISDSEDLDIDGDGWDNDIELNCSTDQLISSSVPSDIDGDMICDFLDSCLLYTSPSPRDVEESRMPSSA